MNLRAARIGLRVGLRVGLRIGLRVTAPAALAVLLALAVLFGLTGCASGHRQPYSGDEPEVRSLPELEGELRGLAGSGSPLRLVELGRVGQGSFAAPLWLLRFQPAGARRRVLLCAGIHGNEPAGTAWALEWAHHLADSPEAWADTAFDILPLMNPWGWSRNVRFSAGGRDVNRDFASFAIAEARLLRDFLRGQRYQLVLDHHEDPDASGFYLYQYARRDTSAARRVIRRVADGGFPVEQEVSMVILRTRDGLIRAPRWGLWYMRLTRQLSLTNWLRLQGNPRVYTVETPAALPLPDRLRLHRLAFTLLLEDL
jgi:protein MpaA